jgi:hypothetical protein
MQHSSSPPSGRRTFTKLLTGLALAGAVLGFASAGPTTAAEPRMTTAAYTPTVDGYTAGDAAIASVDLSGTWSFTPVGQSATTISVPGGGWYKQSFTSVNEAVYSRTITIPNTGQPQSTWIEFGAVNHQATLSVDGQAVATQTTAFTASDFDISAYAAPGTTHTISVDVKGRGALKNPANGKYEVPDAAEWSEAVPQGIFRSAFLRVYPAVHISDTFVQTSVSNKTLSYVVSVANTSDSAHTVTVSGSLSSWDGASYAYPALPTTTITVAAHSTAKVTVGPVAWNLGSSSYWWPNVPYQSGYRAQLHVLAVHAVTDTGATSDASYRFGFREIVQSGNYYYLNGARVNFRGDDLQGADFDRIDSGGKGDAYDTLPGFLSPSSSNPGWPAAVDDYQRLNYNVVRIHQEPATPYMLDTADEMGLMIIDETAIRGSNGLQDFVAGHDNMIYHATDLVLRDRNHPSVIRWSQSNEPGLSGTDSEGFEESLYNVMNGNDGTRPISIDGQPPGDYPDMTQSNFTAMPHYLDGLGTYGTSMGTPNGRPTGEGEYIWPACSTRQGFEWFATETAAKRGKDASDLRPYTLLSGWDGFVSGVKTTDFTPEEGGHPVYGSDNLPNPWSNPQIQLIQDAFNPNAAIDLPYWAASGQSDSSGDFPIAADADTYGYHATVNRNITVFNDDFSDTAVTLTWTAHADSATGTVIASGSDNLTIPLGSRVTQPISFTAPTSGSRIYLTLSTTKASGAVFSDTVEYFNLGNPATSIDDTSSSVAYSGSWGHASGEAGPYDGTNSYSNTTGDTATLTFTGTSVSFHGVTAPDHGIIGISVDGGTESLVDEYSATRTGDVSLWTSPALTNGSHSIRIRVTGTKNSQSSGYYGTIDRFVVSTASAVSLRSHANNDYVTADNSGASPLIANRTAVGQWETFDLIDNPDGSVSLQAHANNDIVTADNAGASPLIADRTAIGQWEEFDLIRNSDGSVSLRAHANNDVVTADNAGASPLIANRTAVGQWEEFDLIYD